MPKPVSLDEPIEAELPPTVPEGPWLLVVGMHRSGTSAMTGAMAALGFNTPHTDDLAVWVESNPEHWESRSMVRVDDQLLRRMGGSWEAPPVREPGWEFYPSVIERPDPDAVTVAAAAYPSEGPIVWKDPRVCLLLPYWLHVLPRPVAALLVWRDPLPVARSLVRRDNMHMADGIALWERYNRVALEDLVGVDTYVCGFESVLADPPTAIGGIATWLDSLSQFSGQGFGKQVDKAIETISAPNRAPNDEGKELLFPEHHELIERLRGLEGGHSPLGPTSLTDECGWTTALLEARRTSRTREVERFQKHLSKFYGSTSWKITQPLRNTVGFLAYNVRKYRGLDQPEEEETDPVKW